MNVRFYNWDEYSYIEYQWYSQVKFSERYKFPMIRNSQFNKTENDNIFAKCNKNIEFAIE